MLGKNFMKFYIKCNFSAWGDGVFLGLQTLAIAVLVMHYHGETTKATAFFFAYIAVVFTANSGTTPAHVLWACQTINIPIVLISKVYNLINKITNSFELLISYFNSYFSSIAL